MASARFVTARLAVRGLACVLTLAGMDAQGCSRAEPGAGGLVKNGDFSAGAVGEAPASWTVMPAGFGAKVVTDEHAAGKRAAELVPGGAQAEGGFGNLMQMVDAKPLRGKRIVVRADARVVFPSPVTEEALSAMKAQMWVRVDRASGAMGFIDSMSDRPIAGERAAAYQPCVISGVVDDDATRIYVGVLSFGGATVRLANVRMEAIEPGPSGDRAAAALSPRGLANLTALTRLEGYVRFFHASDQAAAADWGRFPIDAVERVEPAAGAEELAAALRAVFAPIAPTVQVWAGTESAGPAPLPRPKEAATYRVWDHTGCGLIASYRGLYTSTRVKSAIEQTPEGLPAAGTCVVKDLGGGVWCRVPVCVWADAEGRTLPAAPGALAAPAASRPEWWRPSGRDRSTRLGDVAIAWNVFQHFYPYFDVARPDWAAALSRALESAATDGDEAAFGRTLERLVATLHDGHGGVNYAAAEGLPGPDMTLTWGVDATGAAALIVVRAGPSATGLAAGDQIVSINGRATEEAYRDALAFISAATDQWARYRFAEHPRFTAPGTGPTVRYGIRREGKEMTLDVPRGAPAFPVEEKHPANGAELAPGIVYFDLNGADVAALDAAMPALVKARGIVFDARGYPGSAGRVLLRHLAGEELRSAFWIVPRVTLPDQDARGYVPTEDAGRWSLAPLEPRLGKGGQKIAFVTGGGAISYAESCLGIVEHYKLGEIVGGPTAGTNGNVNPLTLPGGITLTWTGMQVLKHDRSRHHGVGIRPTVPAVRTAAGIAAGRDEVLEAAVKKLSE